MTVFACMLICMHVVRHATLYAFVFVHMHMNSLQSTMLPEALLYNHFTLLAYAPAQVYLPHCTCLSHSMSTIHIDSTLLQILVK